MRLKKESLSRAEFVRQRRAQLSAIPQVQPVKRASRAIPPVTARVSGTWYTSTSRIPRNTARKRYEVALSIPGLKIQMPAVPAFHVGWRSVSFIMSLLLGWAIITLWTSPQFKVTEAVVQGNQRISPDEISSFLDLIDQQIFLIAPDLMEHDLHKAFPDLSSISVNVSLPNRVSITVTERQPVIAWQQDGGLTWIDNEGVAFQPRGQVEGLISVIALAAPPKIEESMNDPLDTPSFISTKLVSILQALAPYAPPGIPIIYDPQQGLGWKDNRGWDVFFGQNTEDITLKLRIYQTMVDWLTQRGVHPSLISVAYPNAPFYRLEQ